MNSEERYYVTIDPGLMCGEPTINHHRITAREIAATWWGTDYSLEFIEANWPGINRVAVLVACWYMGIYGTRTWKKRWKDWLLIADGKLWEDNYGACPLPPRKKKSR